MEKVFEALVLKFYDGLIFFICPLKYPFRLLVHILSIVAIWQKDYLRYERLADTNSKIFYFDQEFLRNNYQ